MRRLSLSLIIVIVISITSLGWLLNKIYLYSQPETLLEIESQYHLLGKELTKAVNSYATPTQQQDFISHWNQFSELNLYLIERDNFPVPEELKAGFNRGEPLILESVSGLSLYYQLAQNRDVLAIALPENQAQTKNLELILTISFYIGVITIILIWVGPLLRELSRLRDASTLFGKGELSARVNIGRFSYIADIQKEFNQMADRIQSLIADNKLLSRAVSHDLKTPLARLRFGLEALSETEDKTIKMRYAERINRDLEEMESLIDTLLQFARLDESRLKLNKEEVNLAQLCQELIEAQQLPGKANIAFHCEVPVEKTNIIGDRRYLSMLFNNLLSNALNYAKEHVNVSVTSVKTHSETHELHICIDDDGPGINTEEMENIFKPFWKGCIPSNKTTQGQSGQNKTGHGMGLAIAARIAEWHKAKLGVMKASSLGGARFCIQFPAEEPAFSKLESI